MTPQERDKVILALQLMSANWDEPLRWSQAESYVDAVVAALSTVAPAYGPEEFTAQISCSRHSLLTCPHCARAFFLEAQLRPAEGGESQ